MGHSQSVGKMDYDVTRQQAHYNIAVSCFLRKEWAAVLRVNVRMCNLSRLGYDHVMPGTMLF
jgi:hypothetical protein